MIIFFATACFYTNTGLKNLLFWDACRLSFSQRNSKITFLLLFLDLINLAQQVHGEQLPPPRQLRLCLIIVSPVALTMLSASLHENCGFVNNVNWLYHIVDLEANV